MGTLKRPKPKRGSVLHANSGRPAEKRGAGAYAPACRCKAGHHYVVFISHSFKDTWLAQVIAERIETIGGRVWLADREISGGEFFSSRTIDALNSCDEAVVLFSPHSVRSTWVFFEVGAVCVQRKRMTPIIAHVAPAEIPVNLGLSAIDLNELDQRFMPELKGRIAAKKRT